MTNSPLIDRKIEEAYGIIRERSEKKKRQSRKRKRRMAYQVQMHRQEI